MNVENLMDRLLYAIDTDARKIKKIKRSVTVINAKKKSKFLRGSATVYVQHRCTKKKNQKIDNSNKCKKKILKFLHSSTTERCTNLQLVFFR